MKNMTPSAVCRAAGGIMKGPKAFQNTEITAVITDSRKILSGCLFAAIRGNNSDGHAYIRQAVEAGAAAVLGEEIPEGLPVPGIQVENTVPALQRLAAWYLDQFDIPAVGIIGSAGKTSTKEMVSYVLSEKYRVLKTEGNFNNELGVPLTIFRLTDQDEIAVIEMGINHFGEMDRLGKIVRPDTVIMTNIGTAHLEFLESRAGILKAKSEVFAHMGPGSRVILNGDDDMLSSIEEVNGTAPIRYGVDNADADVRAEEITSLGLRGVRFRLCAGGERTEVTVPSPGQHSVYNALAGAAAGIRYGLTPEQIRNGIGKYHGLSGRMHIIQSGPVCIMDDCYNANPSSMKASLSILQEADGRRTAVLGDMGELGTEAESLHREVGRYAASLGLEQICCVGTLGKQIRDGAEEVLKNKEDKKTHVLWYETREELIRALPELIRPRDTILVKASRFMGLEKAVQALEEIGKQL